MLLKQYKDDFKTSFIWNEAISIGKIDNNKEKAICFYNSRRTMAPIKAIDVSTYNYKPITILLRYTKNQNTAEEIANTIYKFYDDRIFNIDGKRVIAQHYHSQPNNLGTDENGVYEYSLEINMLEER